MRRQRRWALTIRLLLLLAVAMLLVDGVLLGLRYREYAVIVLLGLTWRLCRRQWHVSGNFGTARVSGWHDLWRGGLLAQNGLILGRLGDLPPVSKREALGSLLWPGCPSTWAVRQFFAAYLGLRQADEFIRINDFLNIGTFSPSGGGKSVAALYPNLLSYEGNCVVIDPKGELYARTAEHRKKHFNHKIVRLDPARLFGEGDCFNPFDWIDPRSPEFIDTCRDMANMLVVRTGKEMDPHWCEAAEGVIAAFIAYICALEGNPEARNLRGMRTHLASRLAYNSALELMQRHEDIFQVLQQLGHALSWHVDKELGSVMSHAQRFTNIFDSPLVAASVSATSFDLTQLRDGRMTLYIIAPPEKLTVWAGLMRIWLGTVLRVITKGVPSENNPVLFLVDECAHIGRMQALEDAITLLRGSGIRIWLFFQSIEQLKKCFGENAGTVLDNLQTQQYFSINSFETAEAISKRIGETTILNRSDGENRGTSNSVGGDGKNPGSRNSGSNTTYSEVARKLLMPSEILVLPEDTAIVFHKNHHVILCRKIKYYADRAFRPRGASGQWGTGRTRGLGLGSMLVGLSALACSLMLTVLVGRMAMATRHPPTANARAVYSKVARGSKVAPAARGPARRKSGRTSPPYPSRRSGGVIR